VIFADEQLSEAVAEAVIARKVKAGELIRAEDMMVGPGLALHPAGLVQRLETAIDDALDALDDGSPTRATAILEATLPEPVEPAADGEQDDVDGADEVEAPEPEAQPEVEAPSQEASRRRRPRPESEGAPLPPPGRPAGFPNLDGEYECASVDSDGNVCGDKITGKQAQLSVTRFRVRLCRDCMEVYDPLEAAMVAV
jgi:hypothetical protein